LLKICGREYQVLNFLGLQELDSKMAGMLSGIYFDLGEYNLAMEYVGFALDHQNDSEIDEIFDPYTILDIIDFLITQEQYNTAETILLELMGRGRALEEIVIKKLGEIYFMINTP